MHKSMQEYISGKSLFQATNNIKNIKKGDVVRLSSLNDLQDPNQPFVLVRNDKTEKLTDLFIADLKSNFVPL